MICAYDAWATDFTSNGMGALNPIECTVSETLNGEWTLEMTHVIDGLKSDRLAVGSIIKAPVPAGFTPRLTHSTQTESVEIYRVNTVGQRLNLRTGASMDAKIIGRYKENAEVVVIDSTTHTPWYEVETSDGRHGFMYGTNLTYVRTESSGQAAEESIREAVKLREQPFRIYKIVPGIDSVTVYARHIFYDLADNLTDEYKPQNQTGAAVAQGILSHCRGAHGFTMYSDLTDTGSAEFVNMSPVEAVYGDAGLCETWNAEIARDWFDVYAVSRVGRDTDIVIAQGKQLKAIGGETNADNAVTRIMPIGSDRDGNALYLPEVYVDSEDIDLFPTIRWYALTVKDAKVGSGMTQAQAYEKMREAARQKFEDGCDGLDYTLEIDFVEQGITDEYAGCGALYDLSIGDSVLIKSPRAGVNARMRITDYTYDCLAGRYTRMGLGSVMETAASTGISAKQLRNGTISASKIIRGSVGADQLGSLSVTSAKIGLLAVQSANIADAAITRAKIGNAAIGTAQIEDASITNAKIGDAAIGSAQIEDAAITRAKIGNAAVGTAQIGDAQITGAKIGSATIGTANIATGAVTAALIDTGAVGTAQIADASVTDAKIVGLTASKITAGTIDAATVNINNLNADNITAGTINGQRIPTLGSEKIADGAISGVKIVNGAVTTDKITDGAVTAAKIVASAVTADKLAANAVTANKIAANAVTAAKVDIADLFAAQATINALDANLIKASNITALQGSLDVWANDKINMQVANNGVNLITGSAVTSAITTVWSQAGGSTPHKYDYDFSGKGRPYTWMRVYESAPTGSNILRVQLNVAVNAGKAYTFSADIQGFGHTFRIGAYHSDTETWTQHRSSVSGFARVSHTFTPTTTSARLCIDYINSNTDQYFDVRMLKLEVGSTATPWMADSEVYNSALTIDKSGIKLSGGTIDMQAGTAFKVKSGGTVQIDASSADSSYINLGDGNFSASKDGGLIAGAGHFGSALDVGGKSVLTSDYAPFPFVLSASKPDRRGIIWLQPSSVQSATYSAFTASSRGASVDFSQTNPITRSFTTTSSDTLTGGSFTYTIVVPLYSVSATVPSFSLYATMTKGSVSVRTNTATVSISPYTTTSATLTVTSSQNLCSSTTPISVSFTANFNGGSGNVYMQKDTTLELIASVSGGGSSQSCIVTYVPGPDAHARMEVSSGTQLASCNGRYWTSGVDGICVLVDYSTWRSPTVITKTSTSQAVHVTGNYETWAASSGNSATYGGETWYMASMNASYPQDRTFTTDFINLNAVLGKAAYSETNLAANVIKDALDYYYKKI